MGVLVSCSFLMNQEIQHESLVINIEVPVRVYKNDVFVNNLSQDDFEIYEDGALQKIEAVYLVNQTSIQRSEGRNQFNPETSRHFYLFFEITEFTPKMESALKYFFKNVFTPDDSLTVVTPRKSYELKAASLRKLPPPEISRQLGDILRRDAWIGNSDYRSIIRELKIMIRGMMKEEFEEFKILDSFEVEELVYEAEEKYLFLRDQLESLRTVDQKKLLAFAEYLKGKKGQKNVYLFYQREFIPEIELSLYNKIMDKNSPANQLNILERFGFFIRDISFDVEAVKQAYADSSITINFMFYTQPAEHVPGVRMVEHSEDFYSAFNQMSQSTGGIITSSANPEFLFKKASEASENYYLLYYSKKNYNTDGKFRNIKVRIKGQGFKIFHRSGYFAN